MIENKRKRSIQNSAINISDKSKRRKPCPLTKQLLSIPKCDIKHSRCRLRLPASLTLHCYSENSERRHSEVLSIAELPGTVYDLKQVISDALNIPIICQLQLSLHDLILFDNQPFVEEVPLREGDHMKLLYYGKSKHNEYNALIRHGKELLQFQNYHIRPSKSNSTPRNLDADISDLVTIMDHMYQAILLPWRDESTTCHRLYFTSENLIDRVIEIWEWAGDYRSEELSQSCMLVLWDFGENLEERLILMEKDVHKIALDIFIAPGASEILRFGSIGLLAGFGEFPAGQKFLGTNLKFLTKLVDYFNKTKDRSAMSIASTLLFTLASHSSVPVVMEKAGTVEQLSLCPLSLTFSSVYDLDVTYGLILFYMALLRNPKFSLPDGYSPAYFKIKFQQQRNAVSDTNIAEMEEGKGNSWGSVLPFIEMLFIPPTAPLYKYKNCRGLVDSYLDMAITILSATFIDEQNIKLCLKEDLYGYLVILSWKYKTYPRMRTFMKELITRFNPVIDRVPSLLHIATSEHALQFNGLGATLEFIK